MIEFKHDKDMKLFFLMHPLLQIIATDGSYWAYKNGLDFVITETITTISDDSSKKRVSSSHREHRAFDLRSSGWSQEEIKNFEIYLSEKYRGLGAISSKTGKENLVEHHDSGYGPHFHIQIHSKFGL